MRNDPGGIQFLQGHLPPPSDQDLLPGPGAWAGRGEAWTPSRAHGGGLLSARTASAGSSEEVVVAGSSASQLGALPPL